MFSKPSHRHRSLKWVVGGGMALIVFLGLFIPYIYKTGYAYCLKFHIMGSAQGALQCGNYYFGVYGPSSYDIEKAEHYFAVAVSLDSSIPDVWHQYARIAFLKGDYWTALYRINMQFQMHGDELMASYYIRGLIEGYSKDYPAAEKDFLKFLEWDPNNWAANNDLAWVYFAQGKYEEMAAHLKHFIDGGSANPWLLVMHAMAIYNLGDISTAYEELLKARGLAAQLTEADWIHAYPGNDPEVAGKGLSAFRKTIENDIALVEKKLSPQ